MKDSSTKNIDQELKDFNKRKPEKSTKTGTDLPNEDNYILLGVIAIVTSLVFVGVVIGAILIKKTRESQEYYQNFPEKFDASFPSKVTAAQIMAIVAISISLITPFIYIILNISDLPKYLPI